MSYEKINRNALRRHHDDWDDAHQQMIEVQQMNKGAVQKKSLNVSEPGDAHEKEADDVARKVVGGQSTVVKAETGSHVIQQKTNGKAIQKADKNYKALDVDLIQQSAKTIIDNDPKVKEMILFFSQIASHTKKAERGTELETFLTGVNKPDLQLVSGLATQGETDTDLTDTKRKIIKLNDTLAYPVAVSTYLHEFNHYLDIWYNSKAAATDKKRDRAEGPGVDPLYHVFKYPGLGKQSTALGEGLNARIDLIMAEIVQADEPKYPHPQTPALRTEYKDWLAKDYADWLKKKEATKAWQKKDVKDQEAEKEKEKQKKLEKIRNELQKDARKAYSRWGVKTNKDDKFESEGVELGFAFEKSAYGFNKPFSKKGSWAVDFNNKFEEKYKTLINWYA